jgi:hypothetical protein
MNLLEECSLEEDDLMDFIRPLKQKKVSPYKKNKNKKNKNLKIHKY